MECQQVFFWVTNSGFIPTANGEPLFTNIACQTITGDAAFNSNIAPSYAVNETCSLLKDEAQIVTWEEDDWEYVDRLAISFVMPGIEEQYKTGVFGKEQGVSMLIAQPLLQFQQITHLQLEMLRGVLLHFTTGPPERMSNVILSSKTFLLGTGTKLDFGFLNEMRYWQPLPSR